MLRVDYEALAAGSKTLLDQGDTFEQCIDTMKQVIEGLPDVWEADTSDRYVQQFMEAEPGLREVRQMIEDMANQIADHAGAAFFMKTRLTAPHNQRIGDHKRHKYANLIRRAWEP